MQTLWPRLQPAGKTLPAALDSAGPPVWLGQAQRRSQSAAVSLVLGTFAVWSQRLYAARRSRASVSRCGSWRPNVLHQHRDAFYVKGRQSGKYLGATHDGHVIHDDVPTEFHLFVFVPGIDVFTGYVKLYHLASDRSIFVTQDGLLGCYHGDFEEHWWKILPRDDKGSFSLENFPTESSPNLAERSCLFLFCFFLKSGSFSFSSFSSPVQ